MLRHIFQFCVLESSQEILDLIHKVHGESVCISCPNKFANINKKITMLLVRDFNELSQLRYLKSPVIYQMVWRLGSL